MCPQNSESPNKYTKYGPYAFVVGTYCMFKCVHILILFVRLMYLGDTWVILLRNIGLLYRKLWSNWKVHALTYCKSSDLIAVGYFDFDLWIIQILESWYLNKSTRW